MKEEANTGDPAGPTSHQVALGQTQQSKDCLILMGAEFKPIPQFQKATRGAWCASLQLWRSPKFRKPGVILTAFRELIRLLIKDFAIVGGLPGVQGHS